MSPLFIIVGALTYAGAKLHQDLKTLNKSSLNDETPSKVTSLTSLKLQKQALNDSQNKLQRNFTVAKASFVLAIAGSLFYLPLTYASVIGVIYTTIPLLQKGYQSLFKKQQFDMAVIESITFPWLIITRHYFVVALVNWLCYLIQSFVSKVQTLKDNFRIELLQDYEKLPKVVWLLKGGAEIETPINTLKQGDIIVVNADEMIPVDGFITEGNALIDQKNLLKEYYALEKGIGDAVFASTTLQSGKIFIQVDKCGTETKVTKEIELTIIAVRNYFYK
jgi:Cu2+-exporting ATPase